mmetsp:Transcript_4791/g.6225  ORF Transcript_4791/g.6225 Transcript_4791/m.6225 type:complete len:278 (+) Transcript_4791:117-950(+)
MSTTKFTVVLLCCLSAVSSFVVQQRVQHQRVGSSLSSSGAVELPEGLTKTIAKQGNGFPVNLGDIATVRYSCYLPGGVPFAKSSKEKMVIGDGTMIDGWEKSIRSMRVGERSIIRVEEPSLAYGSAGVPPLVPPNAVIEMDVEILDAQAPTANIDFDNLALDSTPTTAADIARAFEVRQAGRVGEVKLEGLEAFIDKIRTSYFYGLFEGETGQQAPWFLRPSITFPLAFAVVGFTFYFSLANGAISERGAQTLDELDEIILSSNAIITILANALLIK